MIQKWYVQILHISLAMAPWQIACNSMRLFAIMFRKDGTKRIADHTLVALTVMIAESRPEEKEMMVNLVMTFLK